MIVFVRSFIHLRTSVLYPLINRSLVTMSYDKKVPNPHPERQNDVPEGFQTITEGSTVALYKKGDVFYNQVQIFNRDLSIMAIRAWDELRNRNSNRRDRRKLWNERYRSIKAYQIASGNSVDSSLDVIPLDKTPDVTPPLRIFEALAASGLRSMRYAQEIPRERLDVIVTNDLEAAAVDAIGRNIHFNGLDCDGDVKKSSVVVGNTGDANLVMHLAAGGVCLPGMEWMLRDMDGNTPPTQSTVIKSDPYLFDVIDLDPYGSAGPFLDAAMKSIADGGLLCVTCTDKIILSGSHMDNCYMKYGAVLPKTPNYDETSLRAVIATVQSHAARHRRSIKPLLSVSVDFYVRIFIEVRDSPRGPIEAPLDLAQVHQCTGCEAHWIWPLSKGCGRLRGLWTPDRDLESLQARKDALEQASGQPSRRKMKAQRQQEKAEYRKQMKEQRAAQIAAGVEVEKQIPPVQERVYRNQLTSNAISANSAADIPCTCSYCSRSIVVGGPIWIAPLHDPEFATAVAAMIEGHFGADGIGGKMLNAASNASGSHTVAGTSESASEPTGDVDKDLLDELRRESLPFPQFHAKDYYSLTEDRSADRSETDGGSNDVGTVSMSRRRLLGLMKSILEEPIADVGAWDIGNISSRFRMPSPPYRQVKGALQAAGFRVAGSHTAPNKIKTNAPVHFMMAFWRAFAQFGGRKLIPIQPGVSIEDESLKELLVATNKEGKRQKKSGVDKNNINGNLSGDESNETEEDITETDKDEQPESLAEAPQFKKMPTYTPWYSKLMNSVHINDALVMVPTDSNSSDSFPNVDIKIEPYYSKPISDSHTIYKLAPTWIRKKISMNTNDARFVPLPQAYWGPKPKAHGNKRQNEANGSPMDMKKSKVVQ